MYHPAAICLCLRRDVRDTRELECPLIHHRLIYRLQAVVGIIFAIPLCDIRACVLRVGPVGCAHPSLICVLLAEKVSLACICDRHVACVGSEARLMGLRAEVVVGCAAIPNQQVSWLCRHLNPLEALLFQPLHTIFGVSEPLWCPGRNAGLVFHGGMELIGEEVTTGANDQTAIVRAIGEQVDEALEAAEARLIRVLILVGPRLVGGKIGAAGEGEVESIKGDNEILSAVDLLKGTNHTWLASDAPDKVLVCHTIVHAHSLLVDERELVFVCGGEVVAIESKVAVLLISSVDLNTWKIKHTIPLAMCTSYLRT